ncbi:MULTISPECIES: VOC family protein [Paenibacillus]|uniref:VOC family protein n=1 Tax=Paenibacillus TaxID=44249 RepID=UPI001F3F8420|nr:MULTISPECIES: VOC family protein [Paenibacillus]
MSAIGPDFISLQVSNLEGSAEFYQNYLGLVRSQAGRPHAVVFETKPIAFALRDLLPGIELGSDTQPGLGVALWLHAPDAQGIHDKLIAAGVKITSLPWKHQAKSIKASRAFWPCYRLGQRGS